jgi:hypothetical protein
VQTACGAPDAYGRLTEVQHWTGSQLAEVLNQRVDYYDDTNPCAFDTPAWPTLLI